MDLTCDKRKLKVITFDQSILSWEKKLGRMYEGFEWATKNSKFRNELFVSCRKVTGDFWNSHSVKTLPKGPGLSGECRQLRRFG